jgi:multiple sugar transport system substrate-binding protein
MTLDVKPNRRTVLGAMALFATGWGGAAGCSSEAGPQRGDELVWATGGLTADGAPNAIAAQWNEAHPQGPKVRIKKLPNSADDQRKMLVLELNAGIGEFDIIDLDVIWTAEFAQQGWLVNLNDLRSELENITLSSPLRTAVWDGELWAAPYATDAGLLYYRTDLIGEDPPETLDDLVEIGDDAGARERIAPFVADGAQYEGLVVQFLEYLWGAGGDLLSADGESVLLQPGPAKKAINFMWHALHMNIYAPGFDTMELRDAQQTFQDGQAVFMRCWPYAYQEMNSPERSRIAGAFGIAKLPPFAGYRSVSGLGGHNLAVSKFSGNISGALEFVEFVSTSREVQVQMARRYSIAPTIEAAYDDLADNKLMRLLHEVLPTARPRPATPEWVTISEEMQQQIYAAYRGRDAPDQAIGNLREFLRTTVEGS